MEKKLNELLKKYKNLNSLINELKEENEVILFGGAVRDYLFLNEFNPRDLDLVIKFNKDNNLEKYLFKYFSKELIKKNQYDGYKLQLKNMTVDIWALEMTWGFKKKYFKCDLENLLETVYLNIDSYAYNITQKKYLNDCNKKMYDEINIKFKKNLNEELNIFRALVYSKKYEKNLSISILSELKEIVDGNENYIEKFMEIQEKHYKKNIFDGEKLKKIIEGYLKNYLNFNKETEVTL